MKVLQMDIHGALAKILEIDGKKYTMKSNEKNAKIGVLATTKYWQTSK